MDSYPYPVQALLNPLDRGAIARMMRLNVLSAEGSLSKEGLTSLASVLGSELYEQLVACDFDVHATVDMLCALESIEAKYLFLCMLYSEKGRGVPAQLMTLAQHKPALGEFIDLFTRILETCLGLEETTVVDETLLSNIASDIKSYYTVGSGTQ